MVLPSFARHTLTVITPGKRTVKGAQIDDWSEGAASEREIRNCWTSPATAEELADRSRQTETDAWHALLNPWETPPATTDRVRLANGGVYDVEGDPREEPSPAGGVANWRLFLVRTVNRG